MTLFYTPIWLPLEGSEAEGAVVNDSPVGCQSRDLTEPAGETGGAKRRMRCAVGTSIARPAASLACGKPFPRRVKTVRFRNSPYTRGADLHKAFYLAKR